MTRLMIDGEPISVQATPKGIPIDFTWQERIHRIEQVRERREVDTGWWNGEEHIQSSIVDSLPRFHTSMAAMVVV